MGDDYVDDDGYPTDYFLDRLDTFTGSPHQYVDFIETAWAAYGGKTVAPDKDSFQRDIHVIRMATGGWSGNESIVSVMQRSMFWFAYWQESRRGGGYVFHVPFGHWDVETSIGRLSHEV